MSCPFKHLHGGAVIPDGHPGNQINKPESVDQHARGEVDLPDQYKRDASTVETSGHKSVDTTSSGAMSIPATPGQVQKDSNGELALERALRVASSSQSRPSGVCPFGFSSSGSNSSPVRPGTPTQIGEGASAGVQSAGKAVEPLQTNPAGSRGSGVAVVPSNAGVCPLGYGATAVAAVAGPNGEAKCPLGFTSGIKQRNPLDCARCNSLFFECVVLRCGDRYCRHCAANMQDCILCGADVEAPEPDARVDDLVDQYVVLRTGIPALTHPEALAQLRQTALETTADADVAAGVAPDAAGDVNATADVDAAAGGPPEGCDPELGSALAGAHAPSQPLTVAGSQAAACVDQSPGQAAPAHPGAPAPSADQPPTGPGVSPHRSGNTAPPPAHSQAGEVSPEQPADPETAHGCSRRGEEGPDASTSNVVESQRAECRDNPLANLGDAQATACGGGEEMDSSSGNVGGGLAVGKEGQTSGTGSGEKGEGRASDTGEGVKGEGQAVDTVKGEKGNGAVFLLDIGVRSMMGGNPVAALSRLQRCEGILIDQLEGAGAGPAVCSQLGAVCGLQGDCQRQNGDLGEAEEHYRRAVKYLSACEAPSDEVLQALAVSLNKVGDTRYASGDVAAAKSWYAKGLDTRHEAYVAAQSASPESCIRQTLDLTVSLCKMADIEQALGNAGDSDARLCEARKLLKGIGKAAVPSDGPLLAKYHGLCTFTGVDKEEDERPVA